MTSALVIEYFGGTNYVVFTREDRDEGRILRKGEFSFARKFTILNNLQGSKDGVVW